MRLKEIERADVRVLWQINIDGVYRYFVGRLRTSQVTNIPY